MLIRDKIYFIKIAIYLSFITNAVAEEVTPLQRSLIISSDPSWINNLPKATFTLPKSSEYREIAPQTQTSVDPPPIQNQIHPAINPATEIAQTVRSESLQPTKEQINPVVISESVPAAKSIGDNPLVNLPETPLNSPGKQLSPAPPQRTEIRIPPKIDMSRIKRKSVTRGERKPIIFWRVQIAEGKDLEQLREYRQSFNDQHGKLIPNAEPIISMDEAGRLFHLQLKPLLNQDKAQHWCAILKEHGHEQCQIIKVMQTPPPAWQIQIIAKRNLGELQEYQKDFLNQYSNYLKGYKLSISLSESGDYFRLRVKSIPTESIAHQMCSNIKNQGADCFVTKKSDIYAF